MNDLLGISMRVVWTNEDSILNTTILILNQGLCYHFKPHVEINMLTNRLLVLSWI